MVAKKVWFEGERIYIETDDGRTLWQSILYYQRLRNATKEQREDYELGAFGTPGDKRFGCCPTDGDAAEFVGTVYTGN